VTKKPKRNNPLLPALALAAILLGFASLASAITTGIVQFFHFMQSGHYITVPTDTLTLDLEPNTPYAIYHQRTGTHNTTNQPLIELPAALDITAADAQTSEPIDLNTADWTMETAFFGLNSKRRAIRDFTAPPSGSITLTLTGIEEQTVLYLGRPQTQFSNTHRTQLLTWAAFSFVLIIVGSVVLIHALTTSTDDKLLRELTPSR
jgi:hypothetical protein